MNFLCVDDDVVSLKILGQMCVECGHTPLLARSAEEALSLMKREHVDVVITDWMMPGMDGLGLCRDLRKLGHEGYLPIILLTAKTGDDDLVRALTAGADAFCRKPLELGELKAQILVINRFRGLESALSKKVRELETANQIIEQMAMTDCLTRVPNRRACLNRLEAEIKRAKRHSHKLSIFLLDLDHFKRINDIYGHETGDRVLREAACRITAALRTEDFFGRYGGEEFLGILTETDLPPADEVWRRVLRSLSDPAIELPGGTTLQVTASIGVAGLKERDTADELVSRADDSLYIAKSNGRNQVCCQ